MRKKLLAGGVAAVLVAGIGATTWVAVADEHETRGACTGTAYELSVEPDDGGWELSYELQALAPGQAWALVVEQGGTTVLDGERLSDEDAEIDLDVPVDEDGADDFTVTATPADGEPCIATLTR